jgi:hypothetical protein
MDDGEKGLVVRNGLATRDGFVISSTAKFS